MNSIFNNYNLFSHAVTDNGFTPADSSGEANFNSGISLNNNHSMFSVTLPAGAAGTVATKFAYHQFLGHLDPKVVQVIPVSTTAGLFPVDTFLIQAFDNSPVVNRELVFRITYLKTTSAQITIKFFAVVE